MSLQEIQQQIKEGKHPQFELKDVVMCKCGLTAIFWKTGYVCPSITAYPCKYNNAPNNTQITKK